MKSYLVLLLFFLLSTSVLSSPVETLSSDDRLSDVTVHDDISSAVTEKDDVSSLHDDSSHDELPPTVTDNSSTIVDLLVDTDVSSAQLESTRSISAEKNLLKIEEDYLKPFNFYNDHEYSDKLMVDELYKVFPAALRQEVQSAVEYAGQKNILTIGSSFWMDLFANRLYQSLRRSTLSKQLSNEIDSLSWDAHLSNTVWDLKMADLQFSRRLCRSLQSTTLAAFQLQMTVDLNDLKTDLMREESFPKELENYNDDRRMDDLIASIIIKGGNHDANAFNLEMRSEFVQYLEDQNRVHIFTKRRELGPDLVDMMELREVFRRARLTMRKEKMHHSDFHRAQYDDDNRMTYCLQTLLRYHPFKRLQCNLVKAKEIVELARNINTFQLAVERKKMLVARNVAESAGTDMDPFFLNAYRQTNDPSMKKWLLKHRPSLSNQVTASLTPLTE